MQCGAAWCDTHVAAQHSMFWPKKSKIIIVVTIVVIIAVIMTVITMIIRRGSRRRIIIQKRSRVCRACVKQQHRKLPMQCNVKKAHDHCHFTAVSAH